jgi:hypothetical protein
MRPRGHCSICCHLLRRHLRLLAFTGVEPHSKKHISPIYHVVLFQKMHKASIFVLVFTTLAIVNQSQADPFYMRSSIALRVNAWAPSRYSASLIFAAASSVPSFASGNTTSSTHDDYFMAPRSAEIAVQKYISATPIHFALATTRSAFTAVAHTFPTIGLTLGAAPNASAKGFSSSEQAFIVATDAPSIVSISAVAPMSKSPSGIGKAVDAAFISVHTGEVTTQVPEDSFTVPACTPFTTSSLGSAASPLGASEGSTSASSMIVNAGATIGNGERFLNETDLTLKASIVTVLLAPGRMFKLLRSSIAAFRQQTAAAITTTLLWTDQQPNPADSQASAATSFQRLVLACSAVGSSRACRSKPPFGFCLTHNNSPPSA